MKSYNVTGYSLLAVTTSGGAALAPAEWGPVYGAVGALGYVVLVWFFGGLYVSDIMHMGIAHKTLEYRPAFIKLVTLGWNTFGIYINPTTWVNRHRHHHAFSDQPGDPNKLAADGFWKTLYLCFYPYHCRTNLTKDRIFKTRTMRLVSSPTFAIFSQFSSFGVIWLIVRSWQYAAVLWVGARLLGLWVNMIQNYWTHDRRYGTRRYNDEEDNAMNLTEWLPVTASFSACLQNNHHHFPHFLRMSHDNREYDFGFLTVRVMKKLGLVKPTSSGAQMPPGVPLNEVGL